MIVQLTKGPRVLHVGCVGGGLPRSAAERQHWLHGALVDAGFSVVGGDIQKDAIDAMAREGFEVLYLDAENIPSEGEKFDSIIAGELIEHLENPGRFLSTARHRLKPGGRLILTTPNPWSPMYFLMYLKSAGRSWNPEHVAWFDRQLLYQLLLRTGFRVIETHFVDDLRSDIVNDTLYRLYCQSWSRIRKFLPSRFRNDVIVVAETNGA